MSDVVNVYDAKTHLSRLLARVERGEEVVIGRHGRPIARIVPYRASHDTRQPGALAGTITIAPNFDEWTDEDEAAWYGPAS